MNDAVLRSEAAEKELEEMRSYVAMLQLKFVTLGGDESRWGCDDGPAETHDDPSSDDRLISLESVMRIHDSLVRPSFDTPSRCVERDSPSKLMCSKFTWTYLTKFSPSINDDVAEQGIAPGQLGLFNFKTHIDYTWFEEVPLNELSIAPSFGAAWGDFDNDGYPDLYVNNHYWHPLLLRNLRNGTFEDVAKALLPSKVTEHFLDKHGGAWADFDGDGNLDLLEVTGAMYGTSAISNNLYHNVNGKFIEESAKHGIDYPFARGRTVSWLDFDQDGHLDVFIATQKRADGQDEYNYTPKNESVWVPPPPSTGFHSVISDAAFADIDGNGYNNTDDVIKWNIQDVYKEKGVTCGALAVGDFDNDADMDIFLLTYLSYSNSPNVMLINQGDGEFTIKTDGMGAAGTTFGRAESVAVADYDLDGRLDLFITNGKGTPPFDIGPMQLFHNNAKPRHWLEIDIVGGVTENPHGFGGRVFVTACGKKQMRDVSNGVHFASQNSIRLHFGLGPCKTITELKVWWPRSKKFQYLHKLDANQIITINENFST
eukprot:gene15073-17842_t